MTISPTGSTRDPYQLFTQLFNRRSRRYRNLVVAVVFLGFATPLAAMVFFAEWRVLLGWLLVIPVTGFALTLDARSVARWRATLLDGWVAGTADLDSLREGLTSIKSLPAGTIAGMLDPLPTRSRLGLAGDPTHTVREALAATVKSVDVSLLRGMAIGATMLTATVVLVGSAAAMISLWPLLGLPFTLALGQAARRFGSRPPRSWLMLVRKLRADGLDILVFAELVRKLDWPALPERTVERWLAAATVV